jgi:hypothetical protein
MKIEKMVRTLGMPIAALVIGVVSTQAMAQESSTVGHASREESLRQALKAWDESEDPSSDRYIASFRDLGGDGREEAVVYFFGPDWCGTGGCVTLVLAESGSSWKVISRIATTRLPIRVLNSKSHGWHSIGVWIQGGGIYPGYEATLKFNGKAYPSSIPEAPESPASAPAGEILIPDDRKAAKPVD